MWLVCDIVALLFVPIQVQFKRGWPHTRTPLSPESGGTGGGDVPNLTQKGLAGPWACLTPRRRRPAQDTTGTTVRARLFGAVRYAPSLPRPPPPSSPSHPHAPLTRGPRPSNTPSSQEPRNRAIATVHLNLEQVLRGQKPRGRRAARRSILGRKPGTGRSWDGSSFHVPQPISVERGLRDGRWKEGS